MPNWCYTSYIVTGGKKEVCDLHEKMISLEEREKSLVKNGFGKTWLGNLVAILGEKWENISCRGEFFNLQKDDGDEVLRFETMTAWNELSGMRQFLRSKYPSIKFYYRSEEPGMCVYCTNDADGEYFPEQFKVEQWEHDDEYCGNQTEVFEIIEEKTGITVHNLDEMNKAVNKYNQTHEDEEIYIHVFEITN